MKITFINSFVQLMVASAFRVKDKQSSIARIIRKSIFYLAQYTLENSVNTLFGIFPKIIFVTIMFCFFMMFLSSCNSEHKGLTLQQKCIVSKIMEDNNLTNNELLFFNDSLLIFKKTDKVNLSTFLTIPYPFPKFYYQGPVFDFDSLSTSLNHLNYIKISNTSQNVFDYSYLSNFEGIEYLFLTNVKKDELLSLRESKIPVLILYGDEKYYFPANNFYKIIKNARNLAISNIVLTGNSMHWELEALSNLRLVGNYQPYFIESFYMPNLKVIELYNMKLNIDIIKHILNHHNNISLNIWACEIESLQLLETLNTSMIKFTINESIINKENNNEFIYSLTNIDEYQQISQ